MTHTRPRRKRAERPVGPRVQFAAQLAAQAPAGRRSAALAGTLMFLAWPGGRVCGPAEHMRSAHDMGVSQRIVRAQEARTEHTARRSCRRRVQVSAAAGVRSGPSATSTRR